ncbi:MAG: hypothetical protein QJR10_04670 [Bacillota bacterium]|nr:hypothetical protein [Bacillota bacterium]
MNLPVFADNTSQSRTRTNFSVRDAAGLWWSNGESLYRCYSPAGMGWRPTVIEGIFLWLIAPLLLVGGSAMVHCSTRANRLRSTGRLFSPYSR